MRRLIIEEPLSSAAVWSRRLAVFALAVAAIGLALAQVRAIDALAGLAVLGAAILVACGGVLLALTAFVVIWRTGRRGLGMAISTLILAAILMAFPAYLAFQALRLPVINDVSTDLIDPPDFSRSAAALAARKGHANGELPGASRQAQRRAYPDVQPIVLDLEMVDAWPLVLSAVGTMRWTIVDRSQPGGRQGQARIDAVDVSMILRFPDDITIRLRPLAGQTRIDIRSASRYGRHDFGVNARRIRRFATELQTQLDAR
ncbi:MAG: DUF1499 domain-containing protein [Beijerinckiaceae bacterium]|jgi:uncharacterized protein (DUF1499 family)|nr:DUF1499 domain-containing protein [Beijerinckiaceae bacterium]